MKTVNTILDQLCNDLNARAALLSDIYGRIYAKCGELGDLPEETLSALMSGGFATLMEAGRTIDEDSDAVYLAYREGKYRNLYSISVGTQHLVIVIIERAAFADRLGTVWFYARQAALNLNRAMEDQLSDHAKNIPGTGTAEDFDGAYDSLFYSNDDKP